MSYIITKHVETNSVLYLSIQFIKSFIDNITEESMIFYKLLEKIVNLGIVMGKIYIVLIR